MFEFEVAVMNRNWKESTMPLLINVRHLEEHDLHFQGEIPAEELDIDTRDEVIAVHQPLAYDLTVQMLQEGLLVSGRLSVPLDCKCVRCLKSFEDKLELPDWRMHLPFQGEDAVAVVNDCVDLTPILREDILLEFPQHPLCDRDCRGLPTTDLGKPAKTIGSDQEQGSSSAWDELNKLKLKN
jgi:uncharacterized protein